MQSVCVFCGSSRGAEPAFAEAAEGVGRLLAAAGRRLVFGGGRGGLMGVVADAALRAGGDAVGVIPHSMVESELAHTGLTELHVVETMHQRKAMMADLSDGFLTLPGGVGTLEEFFETWTWGQLGLHDKPFGLLNVGGFYDPLLAFLDRLVAAGFVKPHNRDRLIVSSSAEDVLALMAGSPSQ